MKASIISQISVANLIIYPQSRCRDDNGEELQRQLEETVKSQRCRLLALQSHLQCALEAGQAALPAFRTELSSIRKLTIELNQVANDQFKLLQTEITQNIVAVFASVEKTSADLQTETNSQNRKLDQEKEKITEELLIVRRELEDWKNRSVHWQEEKKALITSAQLCLQQREEELEQQRVEQLRNQRIKHKQEIEALKEAVKTAEDKCRATVGEWQSASEQVSNNFNFYLIF